MDFIKIQTFEKLAHKTFRNLSEESTVRISATQKIHSDRLTIQHEK